LIWTIVTYTERLAIHIKPLGKKRYSITRETPYIGRRLRPVDREDREVLS